mmetsp:Transcript_15939/g.24648  ORF Transcript_15939/g.24648 Transcript_15939/m.24648 type:complete len:83 (+) Transcript_15939:29-277(+)
MVVGILTIKLFRGRLTHDTEFFGSMDPYVLVKIGDNHEWKSMVATDGGKRPNFKNDSHSFKLGPHDSERIDFKVLDKEDFKS